MFSGEPRFFINHFERRMNGCLSTGSGAAADSRANTPEVRTMFARRFAIVCLAAAFAGGGLAMLVQENTRAPYSCIADDVRTCRYDSPANCLRRVY